MAKRTIGWPRRGWDLTIATEGPHEQMPIARWPAPGPDNRQSSGIFQAD